MEQGRRPHARWPQRPAASPPAARASVSVSRQRRRRLDLVAQPPVQRSGISVTASAGPQREMHTRWLAPRRHRAACALHAGSGLHRRAAPKPGAHRAPRPSVTDSHAASRMASSSPPSSRRGSDRCASWRQHRLLCWVVSSVSPQRIQPPGPRPPDRRGSSWPAQSSGHQWRAAVVPTSGACCSFSAAWSRIVSQHAVARAVLALVVHDDQRLIDHRRQQVQHVLGRQRVAACRPAQRRQGSSRQQGTAKPVKNALLTSSVSGSGDQSTSARRINAGARLQPAAAASQQLVSGPFSRRLMSATPSDTRAACRLDSQRDASQPAPAGSATAAHLAVVEHRSGQRASGRARRTSARRRTATDASEAIAAVRRRSGSTG